MSILIKGMEMPSSCCACNLCTKYLFETPPFCDVTMKRIDDWSKRSDDCPLVHIPPHGDLIERSAIGLSDFEIAMCCGDYKDGMRMLLEKVESAPTIIPAEEGE